MQPSASSVNTLSITSVSMLRLAKTRSNTCSIYSDGINIARLSSRLSAGRRAIRNASARERIASAWESIDQLGTRVNLTVSLLKKLRYRCRRALRTIHGGVGGDVHGFR
jgi:hypothetical protein